MTRRAVLFFVCALIMTLTLVDGSFGEGPMQVLSPAFKDGARIPPQYVMRAIGGENISPPLNWKDAPKEAKSFAISIVDLHPVANNWVHWLVVDIPADVRSIPAGASGRSMPAGSVELKNSYGSMGYGGPQPPKGTGEHPYIITLYALKVSKVAIGRDAGLKGFEHALHGKILAEASITAYFGQ
ncbi:YbhB/YbcL family Raf kinase inhibitor-like protein [Desulfoferrobacter suflitae]|uniref:YbhB/YbcL family Raf kinase inhibitor-like protein n=1 Tax=Desulfoferrobacter suflitae TaxID=2865782 RepID=UPI00216463F1|nr:YbhB/YbcL family Raf kinase inhibitor-like protein [Desulfoferrobacter suflitae]MCK8600462.1 YbhB/YbcL family Raf kinase inhibitor-like protein [Desulfoferrobacter suflitae]